MKTKSVLLVCFITAAIFSSSMIGYIFGTTVIKEEATPHNPVQVKQNASPSETEIAVLSDQPGEKDSRTSESEASKDTYVLREESGKIALFTKSADGKETLHSSYDVPIAFLPKNDREMLKKGLEFNSLDEIMKFIEDYVG